MPPPQRWINKVICEALTLPVVGSQTKNDAERKCTICGDQFVFEKSRFCNIVRHMTKTHAFETAAVDLRVQDFEQMCREKSARNKKRKNEQQNRKYAQEKEEFQQIKKVKINRYWEHIEQFYFPRDYIR
jgi:hypothetical protein